MTKDSPVCHECGLPITSGGLVLSLREDDDRRTCRMLWRCGGRHVWWGWTDRPDEPVEPCPFPGLFR
ncbi:dehydrogenase [Streptomyces sp. PmtA]|uniref:dehydrogenase n=1 Tax=Streptomyces sp. PmtA TaxID=3074275 RepID=UPI003014F1F5